MPKASEILYYILHFEELRSMIQWKVWHNPVHERHEDKETETQKICFKYLNQTSRSFSAVIQELTPELLIPVSIFYLVLRGLDTVEDDTSISAKTKEPILRDFHKNLFVDGWHFDGNRPEEKDRDLLVNFQYIIEEFKNMKPAYQEIIRDICDKMGNGMADYALNAEFNEVGVDTIAEYDLYCFYVAGLVGEGLTRMFVEGKFANPVLLDRPNLHESMGLFLQKTNIIRDIKEDCDDNRRFWPKEIWSNHVENFEDLLKPEYREAALNCSSEMVLNALSHVEECLFYLAGLKDQSCFNFAAIPQSMAIATLEKCFRNPKMFEGNVKITKGKACQLMIESTQNLKLVCEVFKQHCQAIRRKNRAQDPNFLKISIQLGKIEQFIESIYPAQATPKAPSSALARPGPVEPQISQSEMMYMMAAVFGTVLIIAGLMIGVAFLAGARFSIDWSALWQGKLQPPEKIAEFVVDAANRQHGEL